MLLQGQRVLVTGSGRGIGRAIALICQEEGATQIALAARTLSQLEETKQLLLAEAAAASNKAPTTTSADDIQCFACDVTNPSQVQEMVDTITAKWGGLDILVNNAGGAQPQKGPVDSLSETDLMNVLQLNVVGVQVVTSAVLKTAMTSGHILNISSKAGKVGLPNMSFYVASKFALEGLTACWAKELKDREIVVNSLSPGMVDTQSFPKAPNKPGVRPPEAIRDSLLMALTAPMKFSGHYVHADELDMTRKCELPDWAAWKPIDEPPIEEFLPPIPDDA